MSTLSRRDALRAIGLGAPAAGFIAEKIKRDMVMNPGISGGGACAPTSAHPSDGPLKFTSFADWFKRFGCNRAKREAHEISGFDGDIIDMHLPMVTKIRMQRARNYTRILERQKHQFNGELSAKGVFTWWA